jgi:hypothetical protein
MARSFVPFLINKDIDLHARNYTPGYERIVGVLPDGTPRPNYGCGWNVLAALDIVSREEAQARVNQLVTEQDADPLHPGLLVGNICDIIRARVHIPDIQQYYYPFAPFGQRDADDIQHQIISRFFPRHTITEPFMYMIVKLISNPITGLGHTILIAFHRQPDGSYHLFTFDVQMNGFRPFTTFGAYLAGHPGYHGISAIGYNQPSFGGKKNKSYRMKKNKRKSKKGGYKMNDPEMGVMTKEENKKYTELIEMIEHEPPPPPSEPFVMRFD